MKRSSPFVQLLDSIWYRPAMYGVNNVSDLYLFVSGYVVALEGEAKNDALKVMQGFREHVHKRTDSPIDSDWGSTIHYFSGSDIHSLELFGQLLAEYLTAEK
jgi:hypothetical protein